MFLGANFHVVVPGQVYRGAQQSRAGLEELVSNYGIRTVVNLRGCCDGAPWHREQSRATQHLQVSQEDIVFSSGRMPAGPEVRRLMEVLDQADYPLYLHCFRGADRTGLACAIYLLLKTDATCVAARRQLGWRYGHFSFGRSGWLDHFFESYQDWLRRQGKEHRNEHFRAWLLSAYHCGGRDYRIEQFTCRSNELRADVPAGFKVRVRNTGRTTWNFRPGSTAGTQLSYVLYDDRDRPVSSGKWGLREACARPGQAIDLDLVVPPVRRPGSYRLFVDMLDQENGSFFQTGSEPLEKELVFRE